ncbi:MAG TPA: LysE family translocator [Streptosporangiales bacterium]
MTALLPFLGLCLLITVTPGLDTAVVLRSTLRAGPRAGLRTALGCALGLFVHATAVALGLAELLLRSETAFEAVKLAGAVLLVLLGGRSLWSAWRSRRRDVLPEPSVPLEPAEAGDAAGPSARRATPFLQGLLTNLTNPKATLFFVASLPQFVPADRPGQAVPIALGLAAIAVLFSLAGLGVVAFAAGRVRHLLRSPRVRRIQDVLLGTTLVALGVRVATE